MAILNSNASSDPILPFLLTRDIQCMRNKVKLIEELWDAWAVLNVLLFLLDLKSTTDLKCIFVAKSADRMNNPF